MRTRPTTSGLFAAALVAAALLSGCGDDDKAAAPGGASAPASTPAATTPAGGSSGSSTAPAGKAQAAAWADKLCKDIAKTTKPVTPPDVQNATDPAKVQDGMAKFLNDLTAQLGKQLDVLKEAGAPPEIKADKTYANAIARLEILESRLKKVQAGIEQGKPADDVQGVMSAIGKELSSLSSYQGPIQDLSKNKGLAPVLAAAPSCQSII